MDNRVIGTYDRTTAEDIHEITRQLVIHLGTTAVSLLAGTKGGKQPLRWQQPDGPEPRQEATRRLMAAHRAWQMIVTVEDDSVARNWFIGANPLLNELSPIEALREGLVKQVLAAATAFGEGNDG